MFKPIRLNTNYATDGYGSFTQKLIIFPDINLVYNLASHPN